MQVRRSARLALAAFGLSAAAVMVSPAHAAPAALVVADVGDGFVGVAETAISTDLTIVVENLDPSVITHTYSLYLASTDELMDSTGAVLPGTAGTMTQTLEEGETYTIDNGGDHSFSFTVGGA